MYLVAKVGWWLDIGVGLKTWLAGQPKHEAQRSGSFTGHMWGKIIVGFTSGMAGRQQKRG